LSYRTAITRRGLSAPMKILKSRGLIRGDVLDYGSGKGQDADLLGIDKYDPYAKLIRNPNTGKFDFTHDRWPDRHYDVITCIYVLNVISDEKEIADTIDKIQSLLKDDGVTYISVRRDIKQEGYNSRTFQSTVYIQGDVEEIYEKSSFIIYKMNKHSDVIVTRPILR